MLWATVAALLTMLIAQSARAQPALLNNHPVTYDEQGKLVSWVVPQNRAYDQVMKLAWNFLINDIPKDPNHGNLPAYYLYPYVYGDRLYFPSWPHNPADTFYGFTESALAYYPYSGDSRVIDLAKAVLDFHIANGLTSATDVWASVPYASANAGSMTYNGSDTNSAGSGDGRGVIEPDKVGELGLAFLKMYLFSGDVKYLIAATNAGNALAMNIRACDVSAPCDQTNSPWPFRVVAADNAMRSEYSAHVTAPLRLFDELIRLNFGNVAQMQMARQRALSWLLGPTGPIVTNRWDGFFEDIATLPAGTNATSINALDTARYLMLHPEVDPNWQVHVPAIMASIESVLGEIQFGVTVMKEQQQVPKAMGSHTARYAAVKALWYEKTGDLAAKETAYRAFNWATYMAGANGQVIDFPGNGMGDGDSLWWTDGYGDYIQHFMAGIGSVPEWTPAGEDKLLRSSSIVTQVSYLPGSIDYVTRDPNALETLKLSESPAMVLAGGVSLTQVSDLAAQEGWLYDAAAKVLKIRHDVSGAISVVCGGVGCLVNQTPLPTATATGVPVATGEVTVVATAIPTAIPMAGPSPTPLSSGVIVATFDDLVGQNRVLADAYAGIQWGANVWFLSAPWGSFISKSVSFNGSSAKSAAFAFVPAQRLISFDAYSPGSSTISVSCNGMPVAQAVVVNQVARVMTNWTGTCTTVTLTSSNGWDTNFDNFAFDGGGISSATATATPVVTPLVSPTNTSIPTPTTSITAPTMPTTPSATQTSTSTPVVSESPTSVPATPTSTPTLTPVLVSTLTPTSLPTLTSIPPTSTPTSTPRPATSTPSRTPTVTRTASSTSTPTRTPIRTPTRTMTPGAQTVVKFDDAVGQNKVLIGQYPAGIINWGTGNNWYLSSPWGAFTTKSLSFNGSGRTSAALTLVSPRKLVSVKAYNGAPQSALVTLQCVGQPTVSVTVGGNVVATILTGWTGSCSTVTLTAGNGWDTNFDDFVLQ